MSANLLSHKIIACAIRVHSALGPGLLESVYLECLYFELKQAGLYVKKQLALPIEYGDIKFEAGYRIDLLVENQIIIEIKSVEKLHDVHLAQVLTYLKLSKCSLGLLINFNVKSLKDGLKRVIQDR